MMEGMKRIAVLYHKDCPDGFSAAWAAWKKFGDTAEYYPTVPRELPEKKFVNKEIYILDNAYARKTLASLAKANRSVTVIDHHLSNKADVTAFPQNVFDIQHSAAVLAWHHFHPGKAIPWFLTRVEDLDLWHFAYPETRMVDAVIEVNDFDFGVWDGLVREFGNAAGRKKLLATGKVLLQYEEELIKRLVGNADLVRFLGYKTLVVNSPILNSQIGAALREKVPPIGIVWYEKNGIRRFSIRGNGAVDVSKLASKFANGGGHHDAAGFPMPIGKPLPWKSIKH